jgi:TolA-binding protein
VKTFPQSPQASFAQLHVGNSQMQLGKYDPAITAFDTVIRELSAQQRSARRLRPQGHGPQNAAQTDKAREAFEFVIKNYPDSVAATVAQQRLQELLSQKP